MTTLLFLCHQIYDLNEYFSAIESKNLCDEEIITAAPTALDIAVAKTQEDESTTTQHIFNQTTTDSLDYTLTTKATNSGPDISTVQQDLASSPTTATGATAIQSGSLQSVTSTSPNIVLDNASPGPPPCSEIRNPLTNTTLTMEEVEETGRRLVSQLSVKTETLSSVRRSKISAPDDRVSCAVMGMTGILFVGIAFGLIFFLDASNIVHHLRFAICRSKNTQIEL